MRTLSINEISNVTGATGLPAGYSENIITAAASIYVGATIGGVARGFSAEVFKALANIAGPASAVGVAATLTGQIVSPLLFLAAPVLAFEAIYPGVIGEKVGAYFN